MYTDESGNKWWDWLIGALIIVGAAALTVVTAGGFAAAGTAFAGVFTGTSVGGLAGFFAGVTVGATITSIMGALSGMINSYINGENILEGASKGFMWGAITGAISGGFASLSFGGVGKLNNKYTGKAVGNIIQSIGQGAISLISYISRSLIEKSHITLMESLFAFFGGFGGGLIANVEYQTQLIASILIELSNISLSYFKKRIGMQKNWLL